jgi:hypothetical protein
MTCGATIADRTETPQQPTAKFRDGWAARVARIECGCPESCAIDHDNA